MISTLEHAAAGARQHSLPRCICKSDRHKVHVLEGDRPLCGGGNGAKAMSSWQTDIGPINCARCLEILNRREQP